MGKERFDFSEEIDAALSAAKETEQAERLVETVEGCRTVLKELSARVDSLAGEFSPLTQALASTVKAVREAATVTVSGEAKELLEREGAEICRKMLDELETRGGRLVRQMAPVRDRASVPVVVFWCMAETVVFLLAAFICTCAANAQFVHSVMLWRILGYTAGTLAVCIALTVFVCHKLKR